MYKDRTRSLRNDVDQVAACCRPAGFPTFSRTSKDGARTHCLREKSSTPTRSALKKIGAAISDEMGAAYGRLRSGRRRVLVLATS